MRNIYLFFFTFILFQSLFVVNESTFSPETPSSNASSSSEYLSESSSESSSDDSAEQTQQHADVHINVSRGTPKFPENPKGGTTYLKIKVITKK